jgi:hypothetical protein
MLADRLRAEALWRRCGAVASAACRVGACVHAGRFHHSSQWAVPLRHGRVAHTKCLPKVCHRHTCDASSSAAQQATSSCYCAQPGRGRGHRHMQSTAHATVGPVHETKPPGQPLSFSRAAMPSSYIAVQGHWQVQGRRTSSLTRCPPMPAAVQHNGRNPPGRQACLSGGVWLLCHTRQQHAMQDSTHLL